MTTAKDISDSKIIDLIVVLTREEYKEVESTSDPQDGHVVPELVTNHSVMRING